MLNMKCTIKYTMHKWETSILKYGCKEIVRIGYLIHGMTCFPSFSVNVIENLRDRDGVSESFKDGVVKEDNVYDHFAIENMTEI